VYRSQTLSGTDTLDKLKPFKTNTFQKLYSSDVRSQTLGGTDTAEKQKLFKTILFQN